MVLVLASPSLSFIFAVKKNFYSVKTTGCAKKKQHPDCPDTAFFLCLPAFIA